MGKEDRQKPVGLEAKLIREGAFAFAEMTATQLKELGEQIERDISDANILRLFNKDLTKLTEPELEIINRAAKNLERYVSGIQLLENSARAIRDTLPED